MRATAGREAARTSLLARLAHQPAQEVILEAMEVVTAHRLGFWVSVMLAGAAQGGCRILLSEDMQDGFAGW